MSISPPFVNPEAPKTFSEGPHKGHFRDLFDGDLPVGAMQIDPLTGIEYTTESVTATHLTIKIRVPNPVLIDPASVIDVSAPAEGATVSGGMAYRATSYDPCKVTGPGNQYGIASLKFQLAALSDPTTAALRAGDPTPEMAGLKCNVFRALEVFAPPYCSRRPTGCTSIPRRCRMAITLRWSSRRLRTVAPIARSFPT